MKDSNPEIDVAIFVPFKIAIKIMKLTLSNDLLKSIKAETSDNRF